MNKSQKPYALYQTLCCNLPKKEPTVAQKKKLSETIDNLYEHQKIVFVKLVLEHYRLCNLDSKLSEVGTSDKLVDSTSEGVGNSSYIVPYGGSIDKDGSIQFDINSDLFPVELKWILLNFLKVCTGQE